jgi:hypothetical protein
LTTSSDHAAPAAAEGADAHLAAIRRRLDAVHADGYTGTEALLYLVNSDIPYLLELAARPAPAAAAWRQGARLTELAVAAREAVAILNAERVYLSYPIAASRAAELLDAALARATAPREGDDTLAELIAKGEAMKEAFFTGDDNREAIACIEWDAAAEAAREAARGEG